ncbi:MAG: 50S ribosomal protein L22 [Gammaproteobacteria bacterium]|nr:50S ribosomal protein L22 [Gammaproteobacteria bacterium]MYD79886.1 50S ribosomal protein L22 [Gammaproteobacteria bacterium]
MRVRAIAKRLRVSPQKVRLIADQIRGKNVEQAFDILQYGVQKGAPLVRKVLDSAVANAETNWGADVDELKVEEVYVNEGVRLKRFRARARGRGARITKRTCHVTITVAD